MNPHTAQIDEPVAIGFFRKAVTVELAMAPVGLLIAVLFHESSAAFQIKPVTVQTLQTLGLTLALPVAFAVFATSSFGLTFPPLRQIHRSIRELIGQELQGLNLAQILILSLAAGFGEEILFRASLQPLIGLLAATAIFALLHSITPMYFMISALFGAYLGFLFEREGLFVPIVVHALYDATALLLLRRRLRAEVSKNVQAT